MANLVYTTKGLLPREELDMKEVFDDNDDNCIHAIEYWYKGELVKRGVELHLKKGLQLKAEVTNG